MRIISSLTFHRVCYLSLFGLMKSSQTFTLWLLFNMYNRWLHSRRIVCLFAIFVSTSETFQAKALATSKETMGLKVVHSSLKWGEGRVCFLYASVGAKCDLLCPGCGACRLYMYIVQQNIHTTLVLYVNSVCPHAHVGSHIVHLS